MSVPKYGKELFNATVALKKKKIKRDPVSPFKLTGNEHSPSNSYVLNRLIPKKNDDVVLKKGKKLYTGANIS